MTRLRNCAVALLFGVLACTPAPDAAQTGPCDTDNAGLTLPEGFCARVFADDVGAARHIVVAPNGDVYIALENTQTSSAGTTKAEGSGGIIALRDTSGDGRADVRVRVQEEGGSGIAMSGDTLYYSTPTTVYRYRVDRTQLGKLSNREVVVSGLPAGGHSSRSLALGDSNTLFVNVGSDSNACGGEDPCAELSTRAAIWRFNAHGNNQTLQDGVRYATGIRNAVGLVWNPEFRSLFATQHGRDGLRNYKIYSSREADVLPSEEFMRVPAGADFGWPYCYHDWRTNKRALAPEYGGDGIKEARCGSATRPLIGFPGHWAPNGLLFYTGTMFPAKYKGGAFIAFHGSWDRARQDGYKVVFVPFRGAMPTGDYEVFADGFAGRQKSPSGARHRPVGLAIALDGSLYVTDDQRGRVFNIRYGDATNDSAGRR